MCVEAEAVYRGPGPKPEVSGAAVFVKDSQVSAEGSGASQVSLREGEKREGRRRERMEGRDLGREWRVRGERERMKGRGQ